MTIMVREIGHPNQVYLVDVHILGHLAFETAIEGDINGATLKHVLESPTIPKVFFDVRNDSDALYAHFNVHLQGVEDVQLMENASRDPRRSKRFITGLAKCIQFDTGMAAQQMTNWRTKKDEGTKLFDPKLGGTYQVFNSRPITHSIQEYCAGDVLFLPQLRDCYMGKLHGTWREKVARETLTRISDSQSPSYQPKSESKKFGPWMSDSTITLAETAARGLMK